MSPARDGRLTRAIRLPHATALVVGTIIGASIFVQPSAVTGRVPTPAGALTVWAVAGFLTLLGCLVTAELAAFRPASGGVYVYLRDAFSPMLGFLWGWAMFWTMHSGILAAIAVVFARYVGWFVPLDDATLRLVAISAILALSAVNHLGVRHGSVLQTVFTVVKVGAIVLMVAAALALGGGSGAGSRGIVGSSSIESGGIVGGSGAASGGIVGGSSAESVGVMGGSAAESVGVAGGFLGGASLADFGLALVAGLFAFGGWHMVTYSAEETVDPRRTIPRSLLIGVAIVTAAYMALNYVYFLILPVETVISSERIAADAANALLGGGGASVMSGLVVFSTFGALAGIVLAGPRVYHAMARDGLLFRWIAGIHPKHRTPHRAIALQAVWASVLVWTESYAALFTRVIYTEWLFFGLMALGLLILRRRESGGAEPARPVGPDRAAPDHPTPTESGDGDPVRPVVPWVQPWASLVFAACAFAIVLNQVAADPADSAIGLGIVLLGAPVYLIVAHRSLRREPKRFEDRA